MVIVQHMRTVFFSAAQHSSAGVNCRLIEELVLAKYQNILYNEERKLPGGISIY